jgi:hypothetical protein
VTMTRSLRGGVGRVLGLAVPDVGLEEAGLAVAHSPSCWMRWVTATRRLATAMPVLVKRQFRVVDQVADDGGRRGPPRLPLSVTRLHNVHLGMAGKMTWLIRALAMSRSGRNVSSQVITTTRSRSGRTTTYWPPKPLAKNPGGPDWVTIHPEVAVLGRTGRAALDLGGRPHICRRDGVSWRKLPRPAGTPHAPP